MRSAFPRERSMTWQAVSVKRRALVKSKRARLNIVQKQMRTSSPHVSKKLEMGEPPGRFCKNWSLTNAELSVDLLRCMKLHQLGFHNSYLPPATSFASQCTTVTDKGSMRSTDQLVYSYSVVRTCAIGWMAKNTWILNISMLLLVIIDVLVLDIKLGRSAGERQVIRIDSSQRPNKQMEDVLYCRHKPSWMLMFGRTSHSKGSRSRFYVCQKLH